MRRWRRARRGRGRRTRRWRWAATRRRMRRRTTASEPFVRLGEDGDPFRGSLVPAFAVEDYAPFVEGEPDWRLAGGDDPRVAMEAAVASVKRAKRKSGWKPKRAPRLARLSQRPPSFSRCRPIRPRAPG